MSAGNVFELAMTHFPGSQGVRQACLRPDSIRQMAIRVSGWADSRETCKNCSSAAAVSVRQGLALCDRCKDQFVEQRNLLRVDFTETRAQLVQTDRKIGGHAIVFNQLSEDLGGFRERIAPEAINRTFREKIDVRALWNHDNSLPIGRLSARTLALSTDKTGVLAEIAPPDWAEGHVESVSRGDVTGMSFGFMTVEDDWHMEDGVPHRDVLDMRVMEVSPVSFPAYPQTDISQREWKPSLKFRERIARLA